MIENESANHTPQSDSILVRDSGSVRIITINVPARRNALDLAVRRELLDALRAGAANSRAIVLTGAGPIFSAGGDIRNMSSDPVLAGMQIGRASCRGRVWRTMWQ